MFAVLCVLYHIIAMGTQSVFGHKETFLYSFYIKLKLVIHWTVNDVSLYVPTQLTRTLSSFLSLTPTESTKITKLTLRTGLIHCVWLLENRSWAFIAFYCIFLHPIHAQTSLKLFNLFLSKHPYYLAFFEIPQFIAFNMIVA